MIVPVILLWLFVILMDSSALPAVSDQVEFESDGKISRKQVAEDVRNWKPGDKANIWELSGLFQGDIQLTEHVGKNGLLDEAAKWPGGVIPYKILEDDFDGDEIETIKGAMDDYHSRTCLRFRPYEDGDKDFVTVQSSDSGCWSAVGRAGQEQVVNLQSPGCVRHGTIIHEFMHVVGFYHQQSAANRDSWVSIKWDNIRSGREHNFEKYDDSVVTDFGVPYDYSSVMHYSSVAFSKNGEPTIIPTESDANIGQREGFSDKDVAKIQSMYKGECETRDKAESGTSSHSDGIISVIWPFDE